MSYYEDIYIKRLNRYGSDSISRLEQGRRANFERFLKSSPHYVTFTYAEGTRNERVVECVFEPRRQNETRIMMDVLCRVGETFNVGDIVTILGKRYMFWYWDQRQDSGYNRWVVLELTTEVTWINEDGEEYSSEAYIYGQEDNMLKNELKSRSRSATLYLENLKLEFMMIPTNEDIHIGSYIELTYVGIKHFWRVTGFDSISTPGIMYVSMDPTIERDLTPAPEKQEGDSDNDFYWLGDV